MPKFLNTLSRATYAIGMCQRCNRKFPLGMLRPDGDKPALRVCRGCRDGIDRNRLPARAPERLSVPSALPDVILIPPDDISPLGIAAEPIAAAPIAGGEVTGDDEIGDE